MTRWLQLQILKQWSNLDRCFEGTKPSPTCSLIMAHNTPPWSTETENVSLIFQDKKDNLFFFPRKINYKHKNRNFTSELPCDSAMEFILIPRSLEWQYRDFIWTLCLKESSPFYSLWCRIRIWFYKVKIRLQDYCGAQEIPYYKIQKTYRWPSLVILSSHLIQAYRDDPQIWCISIFPNLVIGISLSTQPSVLETWESILMIPLLFPIFLTPNLIIYWILFTGTLLYNFQDFLLFSISTNAINTSKPSSPSGLLP